MDELINAFGSVIEVSEEHLHQVTAITGSGPAFLYHVFEQYVKAGTELGLERNQVEESIRNLIIGTSKMIERSDLSMSQLRKILHLKVVLHKLDLMHYLNMILCRCLKIV